VLSVTAAQAGRGENERAAEQRAQRMNEVLRSWSFPLDCASRVASKFGQPDRSEDVGDTGGLIAGARWRGFLHSTPQQDPRALRIDGSRGR